MSVRLSANERARYPYVNDVLTELKHKHKHNKKKAYAYAYVAAVFTSDYHVICLREFFL